jgi:hypothetical protein
MSSKLYIHLKYFDKDFVSASCLQCQCYMQRRCQQYWFGVKFMKLLMQYLPSCSLRHQKPKTVVICAHGVTLRLRGGRSGVLQIHFHYYEMGEYNFDEFESIFRREIAKSDHQPRHIRLSVRPHRKIRLPLDGFS